MIVMPSAKSPEIFGARAGAQGRMRGNRELKPSGDFFPPLHRTVAF